MQLNLLFWGKTFARSDGLPELLGYKPVLHHLVDVAAVASSFLRGQPARLARELALIEISPAAYSDIVGFLAGLHDLGKFTRNFQSKVETLWPVQLGEWPGLETPGPPHWRATGLMLQLDPLNAALSNLFPNLGGGETSLSRRSPATTAGHRRSMMTDGAREKHCVRANGSTATAWTQRKPPSKH